jgi:hypothetical protein
MNSLEYMDYPRVLQSVMHVLSMVTAAAQPALTLFLSPLFQTVCSRAHSFSPISDFGVETYVLKERECGK